MLAELSCGCNRPVCEVSYPSGTRRSGCKQKRERQGLCQRTVLVMMRVAIALVLVLEAHGCGGIPEPSLTFPDTTSTYTTR